MPMPPLPARLLVKSSIFAFALLAGVSGCRDDGTVTISGDVAGLDSISLLGDSLFARAGASPALLDSLRREGATRSLRTGSSAARPDSGVLPVRNVSAGTNDM